MNISGARGRSLVSRMQKNRKKGADQAGLWCVKSHSRDASRSFLILFVHRASENRAVATEAMRMARHFCSGSLMHSLITSGARIPAVLSQCPAAPSDVRGR